MRAVRSVAGLAIAIAATFPHPPARALQPAGFQQVEAIRSLASSSRQLEGAYQARGNRPMWFSGSVLSPTAARLLDMIETADIDGLDADDYRPGRLRQAVAVARSGDPVAIARADVSISRALLDYADDLHRRTESDLTYVDKALRPSRPEPAVLLKAAAEGGSIERIVQVHPLYVQLRTGYAAWRKDWAALPTVYVTPGPALSSRSKGDRVRQLRARLGLPAGTAFDAAVGRQVRAFREAHGLASSTVADAATIDALNQPRGMADARIRLNMERARALPSPATGRHLIVDAAGQRLMMFDGARLADSMKVVVGKPSEPTPMLAAYMRYITVNPYWNVPVDLAASRIAQNVLDQGPGYLQAKGYEVLSNWSARAQVVDPATIDWQAVADGRRSLRVRQAPGPGNMMGAMKFMFPNKFGVYLHDTPERVLFSEADRRRSSGCVRVEDARRLARWLYGALPTAPAGSNEYNVPLQAPVPVFITYFTVAPGQTGLAFRDDVYGRDRLRGAARLAAAS